jgi:hypothetical protein
MLGPTENVGAEVEMRLLEQGFADMETSMIEQRERKVLEQAVRVARTEHRAEPDRGLGGIVAEQPLDRKQNDFELGCILY